MDVDVIGLNDGEVRPLRELGEAAVCQLVWKYYNILTTGKVIRVYIPGMRSDLHQILSRNLREIGVESGENSRGISVEAPRRNQPSVSPVISGAVRDPDLMQTSAEAQQPGLL